MFFQTIKNGLLYSESQPQMEERLSMDISNFTLLKVENNKWFKVMLVHSVLPLFITTHTDPTFSVLSKEKQENKLLQFIFQKFLLLQKVSKNINSKQKSFTILQHLMISLSLWSLPKNMECFILLLNLVLFIFMN